MIAPPAPPVRPKAADGFDLSPAAVRFRASDAPPKKLAVPREVKPRSGPPSGLSLLGTVQASGGATNVNCRNPWAPDSGRSPRLQGPERADRAARLEELIRRVDEERAKDPRTANQDRLNALREANGVFDETGGGTTTSPSGPRRALSDGRSVGEEE